MKVVVKGRGFGRKLEMQQESIKGRKNAFKALGGRLVKVTYCREGDDIVIVTAVIKGE